MMTSQPAPATTRTARGVVEYATTGEGPTLLVLHGIMGGWDQSAILARAIAPAGFRAIALSRPGFLGTPLVSGRTPDQQADLYAAMLDTLGVARVAVIAASAGSRSAVSFVLRHPARCWALVLVSGIGEGNANRPPFSFHMKMWLGRRAWFVERIRRRFLQDPDAGARRAILDPELRAVTLADPETGPLFRALLTSTIDRLPLRIDGSKQDQRAARAPAPPFEDVRVATLVVHGTADRVAPFDRHGAVLARRIPGADLLPLEGGDHMAVFSHRALIVPRVDAFLRAHAPRAAAA